MGNSEEKAVASFEDMTGIRSKTVDEVKAAVNAGVAMAAGYGMDVSRQAETVAGKAVEEPVFQQEQLLESSVASMDVPTADEPAPVPVPPKGLEQERENGSPDFDIM